MLTILRGNRMARVMGVDPSTKTGCVLLTNKPEEDIHVEDHGEIHFPRETGMTRLQLIGQRFDAMLSVWEPQLIVMEGYAYGNMHSLVTLVEIGTVLRCKAAEYKFPLVVVPPSKLKKWVLGVGKGKKDAMMTAVYKQWGFEGTDNECDAFGLAALGLYAGNPQIEPRLSAVQRELMQEFKAEHLAYFTFDKPTPQ